MTRAWSAWVALWDRRESPLALVLVRILLGTVLLVELLDLARRGFVTPLLARAPDGFAAPHEGWASAVLGTGPDAAHALWLVATVAAALVTVGLATRVACVVLALAGAQIGWIAPGSENGLHLIARVVLVILALSSCHARWSLDAWIRARLGRPFPREVPAWPRYLLLLQLVWIYFAAGINKSGAEWGPNGGFLALANALTDPHFARFDPAWVEAALPVLRLATVMTLVFEVSAPLYLAWLYFAETADRPGRLRALANRLRLRWLWLGLGVSMHLGIGVFMQLGAFPWGMLALYPVLLRPADLARLVRTR